MLCLIQPYTVVFQSVLNIHINSHYFLNIRMVILERRLSVNWSF